MFLMVRNDLFHTEQLKGNSENIQEKPKLTYTNMEEMQTKQKEFFGVCKFLIEQTQKEPTIIVLMKMKTAKLI